MSTNYKCDISVIVVISCTVYEFRILIQYTYVLHATCANTVEPQLSEPNGRYTIRSDKRGVRIDEGNRNSRSMGYRVGDN